VKARLLEKLLRCSVMTVIPKAFRAKIGAPDTGEASFRLLYT
jgi:hypothetical protein